jgi:hypothetical protein
VRDRYENFRASCSDNTDVFSFGKEKGCTDSLYGKKSKSIIKIIPQETICKTIQIDKRCIKTKKRKQKTKKL